MSVKQARILKSNVRWLFIITGILLIWNDYSIVGCICIILSEIVTEIISTVIKKDGFKFYITLKVPGSKSIQELYYMWIITNLVEAMTRVIVTLCAVLVIKYGVLAALGVLVGANIAYILLPYAFIGKEKLQLINDYETSVEEELSRLKWR